MNALGTITLEQCGTVVVVIIVTADEVCSTSDVMTFATANVSYLPGLDINSPLK